MLDGKVVSVENDEILGNTIKIEHEKDIVTVYEGIDNITKKVGDTVEQGEKIGVSSTSNINQNFTRRKEEAESLKVKANVNLTPVLYEQHTASLLDK